MVGNKPLATERLTTMHRFVSRLSSVLVTAVLAVGCGSSVDQRSASPTQRSSPSSPTTTGPTTTGPTTTGPTTTGPTTTGPTTTGPTTTGPTTTDLVNAVDPAVLAPLLNRFWSAEANITLGGLQQVPTGTGAGFSIAADGTMMIKTGCNMGSAHVTFERGDQLVVGPLTLTTLPCSSTAGNVETTIVFILGQRNSWDIVDGKLKLIPLGITDVGLILS